MPTLTTIAAALREHSPGVLPEDLSECGTEFWVKLERDILMPLPEPIAAAVLRDAMVRDVALHRYETDEGYWAAARMGANFDQYFSDSDHGGSLGACYQAWRWSKGLPAS